MRGNLSLHLDDDQFVQAFESCTLPVEMFHHRDHIRLAWIYLRSMDFDAACHRMGASIQRFAAHHGVHIMVRPENTTPSSRSPGCVWCEMRQTAIRAPIASIGS